MEKQEDNVAFTELELLVDKAIKKNIFTACSIGIFKAGKKENNLKIFNRGKAGISPYDSDITSYSVYDLASLTKPLVTAISLLSLVAERLISLKDPVARFFHNVEGPLGRVSLHDLLHHSSGLAAHREFFKEINTFDKESFQKKVVEKILSAKLEYTPGTKSVYSDLGYILLGVIIEKVSKRSLVQFWEEKIIIPLQLDENLFFSANHDHNYQNFVDTGTCPWSTVKLKGIVNDDNCRAMGGIAGHAGLFGTVGGVLKMSRLILSGIKFKKGFFCEKNIFPEDMYKNLSKNKWFYGFDTPSMNNSSCGRFFSGKTIGHLGFTGTSFWIDLQAEVVVVILTNRVLFPDSLEEIRKFRPLAHDLIMGNILRISS